MVLMRTSVHRGPITRAERDALPDDNRRHELIDGALIVTRRRHRVTRKSWRAC